jgi:hypothetical protein
MEQESPRRLVRCFSPSRTTSASLKQNADSRGARICCPLHRLAGQAFWIRERCRGPPPTYLLVAESGEVFSVPVWMTEPSAAEVRDEERPRAHDGPAEGGFSQSQQLLFPATSTLLRKDAL